MKKSVEVKLLVCLEDPSEYGDEQAVKKMLSVMKEHYEVAERELSQWAFDPDGSYVSARTVQGMDVTARVTVRNEQ